MITIMSLLDLLLWIDYNYCSKSSFKGFFAIVDRQETQLEMTNKPVPVGITRTRPRFDGKSPL